MSGPAMHHAQTETKSQSDVGRDAYYFFIRSGRLHRRSREPGSATSNSTGADISSHRTGLNFAVNQAFF